MSRSLIFRSFPAIFIGIIFSLTSISLNAAWFNNLPHTATQPDGSVIECFVSGDEFFNWMHDKDGYTIIAGDDGYYYYALLHNNELTASQFRADTSDPLQENLQPWTLISEKQYKQIREEFLSLAPKGVTAPHTGDMNSLVVYIRFSDQTEFTTPRTVYDAKFNDPNSASQKNYFYEVSYENLLIESHHYPICDLTVNLSYQDVHPRAYYEPYHAVNNPIGYQNSNQRTQREHTLLANAVAFIEPEVPLDLIIDADNDDLVDNVCFIIRGGNGAWASLLWAHRWVLYSQDVYIHGKRVWDYTFQPESQNETRTLCHEMFHVLGAPDLYHYTGNGISPVGSWDLMESGFVHMGAYMKWKYAEQNWIQEIPEITAAGTYTLNPLTSSENNAFRIASLNSDHEFFIIEYRKKEGTYEMNIPGSGLLVYRIDPSAGDGNANGPPDEVYIYRPNGTPTNNGSVGQAHFNAALNRTAINDDTNPNSFLQNGEPGGLNIFNIGIAGNTITFDILMGTEVFADFEASATTVPANGSVSFTDLSTNEPIAWAWEFEGGVPSTSIEQNPEVQYSVNGIYAVTLIATNEHGSDTITKNELIIVGNPVAEIYPAAFNLTYEPNIIASDSLSLNNTGDTWLRYDLDVDYISSGSGNEPGSTLATYSSLPGSHSGMTWADGSLYIVSLSNSTLSIYDTLSASVTNTYNIHDNPFSIAFDGEHLWIGNTSGVVYAYNLDGTATTASFNLPTTDIYSLAWDGNYFIANLVALQNPYFHRVDNQGNLIQTLTSDLNGRATQMVWVPEHTNGEFWINSIGQLIRMQETDGEFSILKEYPSPANLSYSLAHDGTDLWWTALGGQLFRIDDGLSEWVFIDWEQSLLADGNTHHIPLIFNTKGLLEGFHEATLIMNTNDPAQTLVELDISLEITPATQIPENVIPAIRITSFNGIITIDFPEPQNSLTEIFDLSGRLIKTINNKNSYQINIDGLPGNQLYIIRTISETQTIARKIYVN
jgi:M6 family metalloprotease-like protein